MHSPTQQPNRISIAPPGYSSGCAAIFDLLRFGFGIWDAHEMAVLLFHAERSLNSEESSDAHSAGQAEHGIWSARRARWVRGPAGVSRRMWHVVNKRLADAGLIQRLPRISRAGDAAPTEYRVEWLAIRAALQKWQADTEPQPARLPLLESVKLPTEPQPAAKPQVEEKQARVVHGVHDGSASHALPVVHGMHTHSESKCLSDRVSESDSAAAVANALTALTGFTVAPSDPIPGQFVALAEKAEISCRLLLRCVADKLRTKRNQRYPVESLGALLRFVRADLIGWLRQHPDLAAADRLPVAPPPEPAISEPPLLLELPSPQPKPTEPPTAIPSFEEACNLYAEIQSCKQPTRLYVLQARWNVLRGQAPALTQQIEGQRHALAR